MEDIIHGGAMFQARAKDIDGELIILYIQGIKENLKDSYILKDVQDQIMSLLWNLNDRFKYN